MRCLISLQLHKSLKEIKHIMFNVNAFYYVGMFTWVVIDNKEKKKV